MKKAKELYKELCAEFGETNMFLYTSGWKHLAIYDYIKDGTINEYIISLYN